MSGSKYRKLVVNLDLEDQLLVDTAARALKIPLTQLTRQALRKYAELVTLEQLAKTVDGLPLKGGAK